MPRSNGVVDSWQDMRRVWDHTFQDVLRVDPSQGGCSIMLTEPPMNPKANRQRMLEVRGARGVHGGTGACARAHAGV